MSHSKRAARAPRPQAAAPRPSCNPGAVTLTSEEITRVRAAVNREGLVAFARRVGSSVLAVSRGLGGLGIRNGSRSVILAGVDAGTPTQAA